MYTIKKLGELAGVSTRTLRYYDSIGLLSPDHINESGYRIYGEDEVDLLQQILFFKALGFNLDTIKTIVTDPEFDKMHALKNHYELLEKKRAEIDQLLMTIDKTIAAEEGRIKMTDQEKFEGLKKQMIDDNESKYGKEAREKFGDEAVDASIEKIMGWSKDDHGKAEAIALELNAKLKEAFETSTPDSPLAQEVCALHKDWIMCYWNKYSKEAHLGLVQMYLDDPRFTAYYDNIAPGCATFLRDAMAIYLK